MLENFIDIAVDDLPCSLPPIRIISHHIDLIPGVSLPNKETYILKLQENEKSRSKSKI
jgi:hypothetical protein